MIWDIVGIVAAVCCTGGLVPQLVRGVRTKSLNDVSPWLLGLLILGTTLWFLYGFHLEDKIIMGANAFSFIMASAILYLRTKYQAMRLERVSAIKEAIEHSKPQT